MNKQLSRVERSEINRKAWKLARLEINGLVYAQMEEKMKSSHRLGLSERRQINKQAFSEVKHLIEQYFELKRAEILEKYAVIGFPACLEDDAA